MTEFPIAAMISGSASGWAMTTLANAAGLAGWQRLYIVEAAVPAIVLGVITWFALDDNFDDAKRLNDVDRDALRAALGAGNRLIFTARWQH
jgi:ABC-type enterobactin transport system permease subunit